MKFPAPSFRSRPLDSHRAPRASGRRSPVARLGAGLAILCVVALAGLLPAAAGGPAPAPRAAAAVDLLLIPDWTADRVMAFDPVTGDLVDADFVPSDPVNLASPKHALLKASGDGILVIDQIRDAAQEFDFNGAYVGIFAPAGGVNTAILDNARGGALRPNGNLLVTIGGGGNINAVAEFDTSGNYLGQFIAAGSGGLSSPFALQLRASDWLVDGSGSNDVHRYDLNGVYLNNLVNNISSFPQQMALAANGNLLVAVFSPTGSGVQEFLPDGTFVGLYAPVTGNRGVYELPNGNILTTTGTGVYEINRSGQLVSTKMTDVNAQYIQRVTFTAATPTPTPAATATPTITVLPSLTPSPTIQPSLTPTPPPQASPTATNAATATDTPLPPGTPVSTDTATPAATATGTPGPSYKLYLPAVFFNAPPP